MRNPSLAMTVSRMGFAMLSWRCGSVELVDMRFWSVSRSGRRGIW